MQAKSILGHGVVRKWTGRPDQEESCGVPGDRHGRARVSLVVYFAIGRAAMFPAVHMLCRQIAVSGRRLSEAMTRSLATATGYTARRQEQFR